MRQRVIQNGKSGIQPLPQIERIDRFKRLIQSEPALSCPFLGLKNDPETLTNYASEENHCHCKSRPRFVQLDHQQMYCLFEYAQCPIYLKHMAAEMQAAEIQARNHNGHASNQSLGVIGTITSMLGIK